MGQLTDPTVWELFNAMFREGEVVIMLDDDDEFCWGRLVLPTDPAERERGCYLQRPGQRPKFCVWSDTRFMCHDGFPVRQLMGADGSQTIAERFPIAGNVQDMYRALLLVDHGRPLVIEEKVVEKVVYRDKPVSVSRSQASFGIGDPYLVEGVMAQVLNPGNVGPDYWGEDGEEVVMMAAKDGARGMLWGLDTTFHVAVT